jgi:ABC-type bacteriocin/lantibiotic exporter with double-glycine peptidase domain
VIIVIATCPWVLIIALMSLYVLINLRNINLHCTRDLYALKAGLMSPVNSLIQDTLNGLTTIKAFQREQHFLNQIFKLSDLQTQAHVTSSSVNRWTAFRIDIQAYLIATFFAFFSIFLVTIDTPKALAMTAIGFQLAVEVARNFNTAVRWTATVEIDMINIQRLLQYVVLKPEQEQRLAE